MANQFTFTCPIFNSETKFAACEMLRNKVWRGEEVPVRKGCQACMSSGKCPVSRELAMYVQGRTDLSCYQSETPKHGKLRAQVLEDIRPVIVRADHVNKYGVIPGEQALIESCNARIDAQLGTAPRKEASKRPTSTPRPAPKKPEINNAAATGDLSAAINQAAA